MSANFNKVLLMGNLTRDVELKFTPSNQAVAQIGIAVNRRYKTKEGEQRDETTFVDCEAWGRTAEIMNQYLAKGRGVFIEGRLKLDQWQDKDGQNRSKLKVVIENFQFVGGRDGATGGGAASGGSRQPAAARKGAAPSHAEPHDVIDEEDIPF